MKINLKLTLMMSALSLFAVCAVGLTLLSQTRADISSLSHDKAVAMADDNSGDVLNFLTTYWVITETLVDVIDQIDNVIEDNRRPYLNNILRGVLELHNEIVGIWCIWEKDALEGDDLKYLGIPGTTEDGRFSPYWIRKGSNITMYPLTDFEEPVTGDYYQLPKRNNYTMIHDPFIYNVGGKETLITTIAAPIHKIGSHNVLG